MNEIMGKMNPFLFHSNPSYYHGKAGKISLYAGMIQFIHIYINNVGVGNFFHQTLYPTLYFILFTEDSFSTWTNSNVVVWS